MTAQLSIDINTEAAGWKEALPEAAVLAHRAADRVWQRAGDGQADAELSIVLGDDALLRSLNDRYRNKDQPTNVLSFPAEDDVLPGTPRLLGDVILAFETIRREADSQEKPLAAHFQHLCVHGVLHLLGHDHEVETEAAAMEALEVSILSSLGIADPYADASMTRPA